MSSISQTSSPLKRQLQLSVSLQMSLEAAVALGGPPLPFHSPMKSFRAWRAALAEAGSSLSSLSAASTADTRRRARDNSIPQASTRFMDGGSSRTLGAVTQR